jgi:hypothetical protein
MDNFNTSGVLTGMSRAQLQAALANAQQAYIDLLTGAKGESYSYSQGEGSRSVTYTRANLGQLTAFIGELQAALGIRRASRRPIRFVFR